MFCTTHHSFAEAALTADTLPVICDAEEQHYLESTGLQPAGSKLWPKLIKRVVKADYISHAALGPAFVFVLTAPSHFHRGHGVYDFPLCLKLGQYFTVQNCFATFESREKTHAEDGQKNYIDDSSRNTAALFPLPLCCSLPSVLVLGQVREGELLVGTENWASCDSGVWGLVSCTSALCTLCLDT